MKRTSKTLPFLFLITILFSSCAPQVAEQPTVDVNALMTQSVGTFMAQYFETQTAMYTPPTPTPLDTPTPIPSSTPQPSPIPSATFVFSTAVVFPTATPTGTRLTPTVNPATLAYGCNNLSFLSHVTVPPNTVMEPEEDFTKTWKVVNTGTCDWTLGYRVIFVSGEQMEGIPGHPRNVIPPAKWTQLDVQMTAPRREGTYTGYWQLSDGAGHTFGALLPVTIVVRRPATYP
jgi:hypothetical protein